MALELVSGAVFWCKLMSGGRPVDLGGPGVDLRAKTQENRPEKKILTFTPSPPGVLLKDPGVLLKGPGVLLKGPRGPLKGLKNH